MHRSGTRRAGAAGLLCAAALGLAACAGYRTDPLFPGNARRIAVPIFENDTFFRQVEFDLTRNVCEELRVRPGINIVEEKDADIILRGKIRSIDQNVLSLGKFEKPTESSATTSVSCTVVERRTGRVLKTFSVSDRVDFAIATGEGLQTAQRETYYELARRIVFELESEW